VLLPEANVKVGDGAEVGADGNMARPEAATIRRRQGDAHVARPEAATIRRRHGDGAVDGRSAAGETRREYCQRTGNSRTRDNLASNPENSHGANPLSIRAAYPPARCEFPRRAPAS
jgi:hypothetical protein